MHSRIGRWRMVMTKMHQEDNAHLTASTMTETTALRTADGQQLKSRRITAEKEAKRMRQLPDHPDIECALRTGYPSRYEEDDREEYDEDAVYEEMREAEHGW